MNNNVFVTGSAPVYTVSFAGALAGQAVSTITADAPTTMTVASTQTGTTPDAATLQANLRTARLRLSVEMAMRFNS